jgi:hypothetical protein
MTGLLVSVAVDRAWHGAWPVAMGFGIEALWTGVATARPYLSGVFARPRGVVVRGLWLTNTIPWSEITEITSGRLTSGAAGAAGARTVAVMRSRPGAAKPEPVELDVLGGYGLSPARQTPAERAIVDLTAHLEKWRDRHASLPAWPVPQPVDRTCVRRSGVVPLWSPDSTGRARSVASPHCQRGARISVSFTTVHSQRQTSQQRTPQYPCGCHRRHHPLPSTAVCCYLWSRSSSRCF